jgi:hypothetical protein
LGTNDVRRLDMTINAPAMAFDLPQGKFLRRRAAEASSGGRAREHTGPPPPPPPPPLDLMSDGRHTVPPVGAAPQSTPHDWGALRHALDSLRGALRMSSRVSCAGRAICMRRLSCRRAPDRERVHTMPGACGVCSAMCRPSTMCRPSAMCRARGAQKVRGADTPATARRHAQWRCIGHGVAPVSCRSTLLIGSVRAHEVRRVCPRVRRCMDAVCPHVVWRVRIYARTYACTRRMCAHTVCGAYAAANDACVSSPHRTAHDASPIEIRPAPRSRSQRRVAPAHMTMITLIRASDKGPLVAPACMSL